MGEALQQRNLPPSLDISVEEEKPNPPSTDVHKPVLTPSPRCNGSTLYYDSFELRAVTNHLNKAMQSLNTSSPTLISFLESPFYSHYLDSIHKRKAKTPKMIMGSQFTRRSLDCKASRADTAAARGGFIRRLWKKVKQECYGINRGMRVDQIVRRPLQLDIQSSFAEAVIVHRTLKLCVTL